MYKNPFSLDNKLILVTGASSGIGRECAISCSKMGANVLLFGRDESRLKETLDLTVNAENNTFYAIDIQEYDRVKEIVNKIVAQKGRIHGLINCAGISATLPLSAVTTDKMEAFIKTNVIGGINLTKHVVKSSNFAENGGSIVFIGSVMGVVGENGKTLYSMTKGALIAAVKSMSIELARRNIRVNAISPGVVETPMSENAIYSRNEDARNRIKGLHPLGLGQPEDVANAAVYLLSDASRWITGTNLVIDGGYVAR
jgi:NAD(P)-dependent dehydrogenase (short-subunit alcohol dehydrogenase family)